MKSDKISLKFVKLKATLYLKNNIDMHYTSTEIHPCMTVGLDAGHCALDFEIWTLDAVIDWFRTESEPSF